MSLQPGPAAVPSTREGWRFFARFIACIVAIAHFCRNVYKGVLAVFALVLHSAHPKLVRVRRFRPVSGL